MAKRQSKIKETPPAVWWKSFDTMQNAFLGLTFSCLADTDFKDDREELKAWIFNRDKFHDEIHVTKGLPRWEKDMHYRFNKNIEILKMKIAGTYEAHCIAETKKHAGDAREILQRLRAEGKIN